MISKAVETRLSFIEKCAYWKGTINRKDLCEQFGISIPQATQDFRDYTGMAPKNIMYDRKRKSYLPLDNTFEFIYDKNLHSSILQEMIKEDSQTVYKLKPLIKNFDNNILVYLLRAVFSKNIVLEIKYQSLASESPMKRTIFPISFGYFSGRYHVRAYCFERKAYRDFVLSRILKVKNSLIQFSHIPEDIDARSTVSVIVKPHGKLTDTQKKCVELEYGMRDGFACITIKKHKLIYLLDELNLLYSEIEPPYTLLELVNRKDLEI